MGRQTLNRASRGWVLSFHFPRQHQQLNQGENQATYHPQSYMARTLWSSWGRDSGEAEQERTEAVSGTESMWLCISGRPLPLGREYWASIYAAAREAGQGGKSRTQPWAFGYQADYSTSSSPQINLGSWVWGPVTKVCRQPHPEQSLQPRSRAKESP